MLDSRSRQVEGRTYRVHGGTEAVVALDRARNLGAVAAAPERALIARRSAARKGALIAPNRWRGGTAGRFQGYKSC